MSPVSEKSVVASARRLLAMTRGLRPSGDARRFSRDRSGNISMLAAFAMLPIFTVAGMAVDFGRAHYVRSRMQATLDSSVLAGGRMFQLTSDLSAADAATRSFFAYRFADSSGLHGNPRISSLSIDPATFNVRAIAVADVATPFLRLSGTTNIHVAIQSASGFDSAAGVPNKDLEVSLVLDVTGSMNDTTASGNSKIHDAKIAAKDLIDIIMPTGYSGPRSTRVALVPFSQYVNVGAYYQDVTGQAVSGGNSCVTERTGADAFTDKQPGGGSWVGAFTSASNHGNESCAPAAEIVPLTNDKDALKASIDGYSAAGWTAGHLGTAWGWYMLSHDWGTVWPSGSRPKAANDNVRKVTVIMTDGDYNTYYHNGSASQVQAASLCTAMKTDLTVYTIGFGTDMSQQSKDFLKACASSETMYFDAQDGDQLRAAFRTIAISLTALRLTQ